MGGPVSAYWEDAFALVLPEGSIREETGRRPVTLTGEIHGVVDPFFPLRSLYRSDTTGKYFAEHSPEEELIELRPYRDALLRVIGLS